MTREEAAMFLKIAYALSPHVEVTDFMIEAAYMALREYPYGQVMTALQDCMRTPGRIHAAQPGEIIAVIEQWKINEAAQQRQTFNVASIDDCLEEYYSTDGQGLTHRYVRLTRKRRDEIETELRQNGFYKETFHLRNGATGYLWRR